MDLFLGCGSNCLCFAFCAYVKICQVWHLSQSILLWYSHKLISHASTVYKVDSISPFTHSALIPYRRGKCLRCRGLPSVTSIEPRGAWSLSNVLVWIFPNNRFNLFYMNPNEEKMAAFFFPFFLFFLNAVMNLWFFVITNILVTA